jgi:hypothetical protein
LTGGLIHGSLSAQGDPALGHRIGVPDLANVGGRGLEASAQPDECLWRNAASVPESTSGQRTHPKQGCPWWMPDGGGRGGAEGRPRRHEANFPRRRRPCRERGLSQRYAPAVARQEGRRGGARVGAPPVSPGRELRERLEFSWLLALCLCYATVIKNHITSFKNVTRSQQLHYILHIIKILLAFLVIYKQSPQLH